MPRLELDKFWIPDIPSGKASGKGELVIAGSGLASIRQLTIETLQYIQRADSVFYLVCDPITEAFIEENAKNPFNLYQMYDTDKWRLETYVQMAELMLRKVREGELVLGLFYGHPGVFVNPSHRAICIAREEGYKAKMLPGISAEDCLFADLGIDPASSGCVQHEATHMIQEKKPIDTSSHLIVWQVGCVKDPAMVFENKHFADLVDYLEAAYSGGHPVINYVAGTRPLDKTVKDQWTISDLRNPEIVGKVTPCSTFYLPPKTLPKRFTDASTPLGLLPTSAYRLSYPELEVNPSYGEFELDSIKKLDAFKPSGAFGKAVAPSASAELKRAAIQLALNHHQLEGLEGSERLSVVGGEGLTEEERDVIAADDINFLDARMRGVEVSRGPKTAITIQVTTVSPPQISAVYLSFFAFAKPGAQTEPLGGNVYVFGIA